MIYRFSRCVGVFGSSPCDSAQRLSARFDAAAETDSAILEYIIRNGAAKKTKAFLTNSVTIPNK